MDINLLANPSQRAAYVKTDRSTAQAEKTANPYTAARNQDEFTVSPAARAAMAKKTARSESAGAVAEEPDANGATAFTSFAVEFDKVTQKYTGIAKAYYAAAHEENLTYDNPAEHIWNKYKNPDSPDFRAGMTEDERSWAYDHEISLLYGGHNFQLCNPYVFENPPTLSSAFLEANQACREQISQSLQYLFEKNGIEIPEDASFRLTVDSGYTIHVAGLEDKELAKSIEQALNSGDNGKNLYDLLKITSPDKHVLHEDNYNYLQVTARNTETLSIGYSSGRLEAVDTSRELSEDSLAEAENQVGLSYSQFYPEPYLNSKLLGWVGPDVPPYEAARLESQFRLGCPRLSAQIHAGLFPPMSLEEIAKNSDIDPKGEIARSTYLDVISQYQTSARETVADYYAAAHRENSSYALPDAIRHIEEKYRVMESAIFRFDLPPAQREMYYRQEMALLLGNPLTLYDPYALASTGGILTTEELRSRAVQAVRDKLAALRAQKEQ